MTHKQDLESFYNSQLSNEVLWITILPTFKSSSGLENGRAKQLSNKIKIVLSGFYITLALLIAEVMKFSGII